MITTRRFDQPPEILKLLAHELRWQLVACLSQSDWCVQELVSIVNQPQNLVSYHLKQLRDAALVSERRSTADARDIYYSLNLEHLSMLYKAVGNALHPGLNNSVMSTDAARQTSQPPLRILFVCSENSARSQMAEGILRHMAGKGIEAFSAGTAPMPIHPYAVRSLAEMDMDISTQRSKHIDEFQGQAFDYVITVCDRARESCPTFGEEVHQIHWSLPDPAAVHGSEEETYRAFTDTARQLVIRIRYLVLLVRQSQEVSS